MLATESTPPKKPVGKLMELSDEEAAQMREEAHEKFLRDWQSRNAAAYREGWQEGWQIGLEEARQQGIQEGIQEGKITTAKKLLELKVEPDVVVKVSGLSREEIIHLRDEINLA